MFDLVEFLMWHSFCFAKNVPAGSLRPKIAARGPSRSIVASFSTWQT